jgi:hypothetical protein
VLRHGEPLTSQGDRCRPGSDRQHSRRSRGADIFLPPYATDSSTETRSPHSATWRASWRHCCCPVVSASSANTSAPVLYPVPPPAMDAEDGYHAATPTASSASALNTPSHTHSGPSPSGSTAALPGSLEHSKLLVEG